MPLFQPTNITPDLISGVQNGIVFVPPNPSTATVTISWTVNGNVPLVAYQIDFYKNTPGSEHAEGTGKIMLDTPFSAIDADGNQQRFSCEVAWSKVYLGSAFSPRYEKKMKITQWWGPTDDQSVVQRSLSIYRIQQHSSISVSGPTGSGGIYTFTGTFTPPDYALNGEISLEWTRWQLIYDPTGYGIGAKVLQDTGKVWGASSYTWTPALIPPGSGYKVTFSALSSTGEELSASTALFSSMEDTVLFAGYLEAECNNASQSVVVRLSGNGTTSQGRVYNKNTGAEGVFSDFCSSNGLALDANTNAVWEVPLEGLSKWAFLWHGVITSLSGQPFFRLTQSDGTQIYFGHYTNDASVSSNPATSWSSLIASVGDEWWITFSYGTTEQTKNNLYWKYKRIVQGNTVTNSYLVSGFTMKPIVRVELLAGQTTKSWTVQWGDNGLEPLDGETPKQDCAYLQFYPTSDFGYNGGANLPLAMFSEGGNGTIMRSEYDLFSLQVCPFSSSELRYGINVYDYSAANGGEYEYLAVIPETASGPPVALISNTVKPCFWNWALFEAEDEVDQNYGQYYVIRTYFFACNLSGGDNGNGAAPNVAPTFTAYPSVMRDTQNRHSGTLSALVGGITAPGVYTDTNTLRDQIRALSTSKNTLFLRNRRGDFMRVAISGEIINATADNSVKQELSVRIPWVEIGPAERIVFRSHTNPR